MSCVCHNNGLTSGDYGQWTRPNVFCLQGLVHARNNVQGCVNRCYDSEHSLHDSHTCSRCSIIWSTSSKYVWSCWTDVQECYVMSNDSERICNVCQCCSMGLEGRSMCVKQSSDSEEIPNMSNEFEMCVNQLKHIQWYWDTVEGLSMFCNRFEEASNVVRCFWHISGIATYVQWFRTYVQCSSNVDRQMQKCFYESGTRSAIFKGVQWCWTIVVWFPMALDRTSMRFIQFDNLWKSDTGVWCVCWILFSKLYRLNEFRRLAPMRNGAPLECPLSLFTNIRLLNNNTLQALYSWWTDLPWINITKAEQMLSFIAEACERSPKGLVDVRLGPVRSRGTFVV